MDSLIAHDIVSVPRTEDVSLLDNVCFRDMFFSDSIFKALTENGFTKPSPIQYKAIPLARCGFDLIVQSKSGTGKTLVFVTTALESLDLSIKRVQTIVLTPTREIALQVTEVFKAVGKYIKDLHVEVFIGGVSLAKDITSAQSCQVAVGAPGRIRQLIELGHLKTDAVRLFILDEADQLMAKTFQNEINFIYWSLSEFKQTLALSATYPEELVKFLGNYMRCGKLVTPETDPTPVLKGLKQFVSLTRKHPDALARLSDKENRLVSLLSMVKFNQCLIFSNYKSRAESTCNMLKCRGWASEWISGGQAQDQRIRALSELRSGRCRILVTTDLTARGIDSKGINLVINMDTPYDPRVYLHRMGRAGRYGSQGVVITILSKGGDLDNFLQMLGLIDMKLPVKVIPKGEGDYDLWSEESSNFDELYGIESTPESIERYKSKFASTDSKVAKEQPGNKNYTSKRDGIGKRGNLVRNSTPPDMNEVNFPSIPCKTMSLTDHFLSEPLSSEFVSLSSLKESLNGFEAKTNVGDEQKINSKGNGVEIKLTVESEVTEKKPIENNDIPLVEKPKNNENLKKSENTIKAKEFTRKQSNGSVSNGNEPKSVLQNVTNQPIRRFSYSDIAKGKRVECKPVDLKPEEIKKLKRSPLKLFPSDKVSNKIEGVNISDKAIDGFSKRMYSSVLKNDKVKEKIKTLRVSDVKPTVDSNDVTNGTEEKSKKSMEKINPGVKSVLYFNDSQSETSTFEQLGVFQLSSKSIKSSSESNTLLNSVRSNTSPNTPKNNNKLTDDENRPTKLSNSSNKKKLTRSLRKSQIENSKTCFDSDSSDYSDSEGEYILNSSMPSVQIASQYPNGEWVPVEKETDVSDQEEFTSNGSTKKIRNLSQYTREWTSHEKDTYNDVSSSFAKEIGKSVNNASVHQDENISDGLILNSNETLINQSRAVQNNGFSVQNRYSNGSNSYVQNASLLTRRHYQWMASKNRSNPHTSTQRPVESQCLQNPPKIESQSPAMNVNMHLGFSEWYELYYQQSYLISNYVRYCKEAQNNRRSFY